MKRSFHYKQPPASRRPLKIFAFDPMLGRRPGGRITIDIANEPLDPGPRGTRVEVIDYDGATRLFYAPVNLNDEAILMQGGLDPTESDPRFHQQMVYAVAMRVLENFDTALGRRVKFRRSRRLRIFPHAFQGANAFYDPKLLALLFGYFRADTQNPGPNLPGQTVFTCLSHDIIAHEMTHAIVDRLGRYFTEPSNQDVAAFHEGFSDIIAIFQHFSFPAILRDHIQAMRGNLRSPNNLIRLASEFGYATGRGRALRSALDSEEAATPPDPKLYATVTEPHERGSILVAAVFDAFFHTYQQRITDLIRIATGGTGQLPDGDLHPDLVHRIAGEASRAAQSILTMCIRAFDYLPPVDITFGDYLRALVTADFELSPADEAGQRAAMIESFRARGIYPDHVTSLAEESLLWESYEPGDLPPFPMDNMYTLRKILDDAYEFSRTTTLSQASANTADAERESDLFEGTNGGTAATQEESLNDLGDELRNALWMYIQDPKVAAQLHLDPQQRISVLGFHPVFRVAPRGQLLVEMVAQFAQRDEAYDDQFGGVPLRGGSTVIAAADGTIRYVIAKPLISDAISQDKRREAEERRQQQQDFVTACDRRDPRLPWADDRYLQNRIAMTMNFSGLHSEIIR